MIIGDSYQEEGNLYGHTDAFGVTYNTINQIEEIKNKFDVKITLENVFLANGGFKHNIYSLYK
jgi:hypothetical protein